MSDRKLASLVRASAEAERLEVEAAELRRAAGRLEEQLRQLSAQAAALEDMAATVRRNRRMVEAGAQRSQESLQEGLRLADEQDRRWASRRSTPSRGELEAQSEAERGRLRREREDLNARVDWLLGPSRRLEAGQALTLSDLADRWDMRTPSGRRDLRRVRAVIAGPLAERLLLGSPP